jgi:hypothetical protein
VGSQYHREPQPKGDIGSEGSFPGRLAAAREAANVEESGREEEGDGGRAE